MIGTARTGPRVAVQIDRADLPDFQRAARLLLAHPLVTPRWPRPDALALVRRWEVPLRAEFGRVLGYRLDVGPTCARLYRKAAVPSPHRGARTRTQRPMGRLACSFLCLALAALESLGDQTTASALADEIQRLRAGDDTLPIDLTSHDQRRAFVDAVKWLEDRGVLGLCDGTVDRWLTDADTGGDALYDVERDTASRLLVASPSVLRDVTEPADFLVDVRGSSEDAERTWLRQRFARRLVCEPVVAWDDLPDDEAAHVRHRRKRIASDLERLTGCPVESRAEGCCLVDADADPIGGERFPGGGSETQAALLWSARLVEETTNETGAAGDAPVVADRDADRAWEEVVAEYGTRFRAEYRDAPHRLRTDVESLLDRFGLVRRRPGGVEVSPVVARYRPLDADGAPPARPRTTAPGPPPPSLFGGFDDA